MRLLPGEVLVSMARDIEAGHVCGRIANGSRNGVAHEVPDTRVLLTGGWATSGHTHDLFADTHLSLLLACRRRREATMCGVWRVLGHAGGLPLAPV